MPHTLMLLLSIALSGPAHAARSETAEFLVYPAGARATALGDAVIATPNDAAALFSNPAGLCRLAPYSATLGHAPYLDTAVHDFFALSYNSGKRGALGVGMSSLSVGSVETLDRSGFTTGEVSPTDWQGVVGYGKVLAGPRWANGYSVGGSLKYVSSTLIHTATTFSGDLGILSPWFGKGRWAWGAAGSNLAGSLTYNERAAPLPRRLRAGTAVRWGHFLTTSVDLSTWPGDPAYLAVGAEYVRPFRYQTSFALRAGYDGRQGRISATDGVNLGFGFAWTNLRVDYSYRGLTLDDPSQGLTLSLSFKPKGHVLPAPLQALVDQGRQLLEEGHFPEAVLTFGQALEMSPECKEAAAGLKEAHRRMSGQ
ncbi:MAG: PorV/PorQ family protein [Elusimicrobia bacterium]|nr:PorV/PorQ family protein [Elusimicrobiota bacterium]